MRRTLVLALLAALLFVPAARAATPQQILRDCYDDSTLQGSYSASDLRKAEKQLPTDVDEYSDCRDVLSRAISASAAQTKDPSTSNAAPAAGGGSSSSGGGGGSGASAGAAPAATPTPDPTRDTGKEVPATSQEWAAITEAQKRGDRAEAINGRPVSPGASRLAADVGRNGLPGTLVAVLALLGAAALAAGASFLRRRVVTHQPT